MLYQKTIQTITTYIASEMNLDAKEKDRIRFGLEILVSTLISLASSLILARILGLFNVVLVILLANGLMKVIAGGVHSKTVVGCASFSALIFNFLAYLVVRLQNMIYQIWPLFLIISAIYILGSLFLWSPAEVEEKPIRGEKKRRTLKLLSLSMSSLLLILVSLSFFLYKDRLIVINISIVCGMLFQSFTINPLAYRLIEIYYQQKRSLSG